MKNKNKILSIISGVLVMASLNSCIKNRLSNETDFSGLQDHVVFVKGGLTYYSSAGVVFAGSDTATLKLVVNLASVNLPKSPIKVTIGVDAPQVDSYNASNSSNFQLPPAGSYTIASTELTIPAGQQYAETTVSFYKPALDPSVSYMLPISIIDASGKALSSNLNTTYYHIIGNPIAGNYQFYASRWLAADSTGGSGSANFYKLDGGIVTFSPVSSTEVTFPGIFGETCFIDFTNNNGVLSDFRFSFPASTASDLGVASWGPGVMEIPDYVNGYYRTSFQYMTSAKRTLVYEFIKQ